MSQRKENKIKADTIKCLREYYGNKSFPRIEALPYHEVMDIWVMQFRQDDQYREYFLNKDTSPVEGKINIITWRNMMDKGSIEVGKTYLIKGRDGDFEGTVIEELDKGWKVEDEDGEELKIRLASKFIEEVEDEPEEAKKDEAADEDVDTSDLIQRIEDIEDQLEELCQMVGALTGSESTRKKPEAVVDDEEAEKEEKQSKREKRKNKRAKAKDTDDDEGGSDGDDPEIKAILKKLEKAKEENDTTAARKLRKQLRDKGYSLRNNK